MGIDERETCFRWTRGSSRSACELGTNLPSYQRNVTVRVETVAHEVDLIGMFTQRVLESCSKLPVCLADPCEVQS
jgi:L-fucose isomerase-like protein